MATRFSSGIDAAGVAGFLHNNLRQAGQTGQQAIPDPACEVLARGVFQALDVVETVVVELVEKWLKGLFKVGEIHHPAGFGADRSAHMYLDAERMAMHAPALVPLGNVGQIVGGLDLEYAEKVHGRIVPSVSAVRALPPTS